MELRDAVRISAGELARNLGEWQSQAMVAPVVITHHGRDRLVLRSVVDLESARTRDAPEHVAGEIERQKVQQRILLEHIQECFIAFDLDMRITNANHRAEIYFGLTSAEMQGADLRELAPFKTDAIGWEYYGKIVRLTQEPVVFQAQSAIHEGSVLAIIAFPYVNDVGAFFHSNSPHEEAVRCLRQGNALAAAVAVDPNLSEVRLNLRGGITTVGTDFSALCGFDRAQLLTMRLVEVLHPHDRLVVSRAFDVVIRELSPATVEARLLSRSGAVRRVRLNLSAVPGDVSSVAAVVIAVDLGPDGV